MLGGGEMINIHELTENDKGRLVVYGTGTFKEEGVLTSWNGTYIFVKYGQDVGSKATRPEDLSFSLK
ncbi:MAG: hypothetical protein WC444_07135 [Candidatus Paceibacterota bacterium]